MKYSVRVTSQFFAEMFCFIQSINDLGRQEDPNLTCVCFKSIISTIMAVENIEQVVQCIGPTLSQVPEVCQYFSFHIISH